MSLIYLDSSALVKLVLKEPESAALRSYIADADPISCELALTEVPRAIRRAVSRDPGLPLDKLLANASELLDAVALLALDRALLTAAGAITDPSLRALDAVHITAAADASPIDAFISYDERQSTVARLAGLHTAAPYR